MSANLKAFCALAPQATARDRALAEGGRKLALSAQDRSIGGETGAAGEAPVLCPKRELRGALRAAVGGCRRETVHRMTRRCAGWDYRRRAIYLITLVQADRRRPALGRLAIDDPMAPPEAVAARVEPSALGAAVLVHVRRLGDFAPEVKPLFCQLMPDHLHAILEVTRPMAKPLGNVIGGFKTGCEKIYRELALAAQNRAFGGEVATAGGAMAGEAPVLCPKRELRGSRLWAPGSQDSILFRAGQLDAMFAYLRDNPRRLAVKRLCPDLFRVAGALWRPLPALGGVGAFAALGNRFLLDRPLVQVQVSRRDFAYRREAKCGGGSKIVRDATGAPAVASASAAFAAKADELLAAARQGAALLSPCVSDGEREIARRAFVEGLPLVALRNKGFAPLEKPSGRQFDACAAGRLLLLAPAAWPHQPGEKPMTRRDALVLNRLAEALAGGGRGLALSVRDRELALAGGGRKLALSAQDKLSVGASGEAGATSGGAVGGSTREAAGEASVLCPKRELRGSLRYRGVTFADVDDWAREAVGLKPDAQASGCPGPKA